MNNTSTDALLHKTTSTDDGFSCYMATVTPEIAEVLLSRILPDQRSLSFKVTSHYSAEMANDDWTLCSDGIAIGQPGCYIANGQHRLKAVIKSGKPQRFLFLEGPMAKAYPIMDAGFKRTIGTSMGLGRLGDKLAGAYGIAHALQNRAVSLSYCNRKFLERSELMSKTLENFFILNHVWEDMKLYYGRDPSHIVPCMTAAAVAYLAVLNRVYVPDFFALLYDNILASEFRHPSAKFARDKIISSRLQRTKANLTNGTRLYIIIRAYNAMILDEQLYGIRMPTSTDDRNPDKDPSLFPELLSHKRLCGMSGHRPWYLAYPINAVQNQEEWCRHKYERTNTDDMPLIPCVEDGEHDE